MRRIIVSILVLLSYLSVSAQIDNTMYFMDRLPQSTRINPAQTPNCKFYLGGLIVPFFGQLPPSIMLSINTPIDYGDVIFHGDGEYADSLITPLHPTANLNDFLDKLKKVNYLSTDFQLDLLNFGFRTGKTGFFAFDLSEKMSCDIGLPKSLFELAAKGNSEVRNADFAGLGLNFLYYHQLAFGYKQQFSKTFSAGLRAKLLLGVASVKTASSDISLTTAEKTNYLRVQSQYEINTNLPLEVAIDEEGYVDDIEFTDDSFGTIVKNYVSGIGNYGLALDFGFSKDITSSLSCYFSVEDLGAIKWNKKSSKFGFYDEDSMRFEGVTVSDLNVSNFDEVIDMDSILSNFKEISYEEGGYITWLPTKFYLGAKYMVAKRISLGALAKVELLPHKVRPSLTVSANFKPFKFTAATLSYSYINGNFNNIGIGLTAHPGPIQWYLVSDNLIGALLFPANTRSLSVRLGCNLVFGCVDKAKSGSRSGANHNAEILNKSKKKNKALVPYNSQYKSSNK